MAIDFSKYGGDSPNTNPDPPTTMPKPEVSTGIDFSKYGGGSSDESTAGGWNGIIDNPITHGIGNVLGAIGGGIDKIEHVTGLNHIAGAMKGISDPTQYYQNPTPDDGSYLGAYKHMGNDLLTQIANIGKSAYEGFVKPEETTAKFNTDLSTATQNMDPVARAGLQFAGGTATDPLSFLPIGAIGKGIAKASDAVGATPYLAKAADAVANAPGIKQAISGTQDVLGKMFTRNYGANPDLVKILDESAGSKSANQQSILNSLSELSQGHELTPDELNQIGHVIEGTVDGTPAQQAFAQKWNNLAYHGPGGVDTPIPQAASEIPKVNPDVSLDSLTPKQFPPINQVTRDNGVRPLSTYTDTLYRESSPQNALDLIPGINSSSEMKGDQVFFSNNKDLALGQGTNKGVMIEFSPGDIQGHVNTNKPTWEHSYNNGDAEFVGRFNNQGAYKDAVKSVTIQPNATMDKVTKMQLNRALSSWEQVKNPDGSVTFLRPKVNEPISNKAEIPNAVPQELAPVTPLNGNMGTSAMLHTASAVNGEPLLHGTIPNWFKHMYDNVPDELKGVFPKHEYGSSGLSTTGSFNLPRTFPTLQDAQAAGLKPELDPFHVLGEHLNQSSNALTNNSVIKQVKNTPGLLFPKDPIDEVAKLVKTGRMTADQAAQSLGMSLDDLKTGFVQSKVPQLSGAYIRPADEAALMEHLSPTMPTGPFAAIGKLNNLYNKGFLLNPLPHMHNIYTNGVGLGGADTGYIKQTLDALKNGQIDPWHARATQAGAINNAVGGRFSDAIDRAVASDGSVLGKTANAVKDSFSSLPTSVGDVLGRAKSIVQPALDKGHDLLWNNDAAIRTSLFRGAVESGASDAEAAAHANKFMVDYNNMTPFEKQYVKPLINFYAWKKGNIPLQASQMIAQTPKYVANEHAKDAISQAVSGQPTDDKGRIQTNQMLPDGSHTVIDPYAPMDEVRKIADHGIPTFLYNSLNPGVKESITQGTSLAQAAGLPVQNKFPIYNPAAPVDYNVRSGVAHLINAMNPLNSSAVIGQAGSQSNLINHIFGMPTNNKPDQTTIDFITKMMGGFTSRDNPVTDSKKQYYQQKDNAVNFKKYMKDVSKTNQN